MAVIRKLQDKKEPEILVIRESGKKHDSGHDESNWLISYADMMTLLCVFYIMLFSMSKMNTPEFEKVKKEVAEQFGAEYKSPTQDLTQQVTQILKESGVEEQAAVTSDGVSVSIAFHSTLFFGTMSAEISDEGKSVLQKLIAGISKGPDGKDPAYKVVVEGHTDPQQVVGGMFPSNWELSSARATRVVRLFLDQGFSAKNLLAIGYADTHPVAESRNSDGSWNMENLAKNRRVVLRVMLPESDAIPWARDDSEDRLPASVAEPEAAIVPVNQDVPVEQQAAPSSEPIAPSSGQ